MSMRGEVHQDMGYIVRMSLAHDALAEQLCMCCQVSEPWAHALHLQHMSAVNTWLRLYVCAHIPSPAHLHALETLCVEQQQRS